MLQHRVASNVARISEDLVVLLDDPVVEVVVLAAPAVERVGEAVDVLELAPRERGDASEVALVDQPVFPLVDSHRHVLGSIRGAGVDVPAKIWHQIQ